MKHDDEPIAAGVFSACVAICARPEQGTCPWCQRKSTNPAVCLRIVAMKRVFWAVVFILMYAFAVTGFEFFSYRFRFYFGSDLPSSTELFILFAVNLVFLIVFLIYRYKTREYRLAEEANSFLVRRARERATPIATSTRRIRRWLLWVPCLLASITSMFVPETVGLASHMFSNRTAVLDRYRVKTPITWIMGHNQGEYLCAITAPGLGRIGFQRYWRDEVQNRR